MYEINLSNKISIDLMIYVIGMLSSLIMLMIILLSKNLHQQYTSDGFLGPQKIHDVSIPRIGGLVIISSIFVQMLCLVQMMQKCIENYFYLGGVPQNL